MSKRLYLVKNNKDGTKHLVEAASPSQALGAAIKGQYEITVPSPLEAAKLMSTGAATLVDQGIALSE